VFQVPGSNPQQQAGGSAVVYGDNLWYFYLDTSGQVQRVTFDTRFVDSNAFGNVDAWSPAAVVMVPPLSAFTDPGGDPSATEGVPVTSSSAPVAVVFDKFIYLLWTDSKGSVYGTFSDGDDEWTPQFQLLDSEGHPIQSVVSKSSGSTASIAAYAFGTRVVVSFIAASSTSLWSASFPAGAIMPAASSGLQWKSDTASVAAFASGDPATFSNGGQHRLQLSAVWSIIPCKVGTDAKPQIDGANWGSGPFVTFCVADESANSVCVLSNVIDSSTGLPQYYDGYAPDAKQLQAGFSAGTVDVGPDNTLMIYCSLTTTGYTNQGFAVQLTRYPQPTDSTVWLGFPYQTTTFDAIYYVEPPIVAFVGGTTKAGRLSTGKGKGKSVSTQATKYYRMLFYRDATSGNLAVYVAYHGTMNLVESIGSLCVKNGNVKQGVLAIHGIVDGPIPIPVENLVQLSKGGTVTEWDLFKPIASVTYGTSDSDTSTYKVDVGGSIGISGSFEASVTTGEDEEFTLFGEEFIGESSKETTGFKVSASLKISGDYVHTWGTESTFESETVALTRVVPTPSTQYDADSSLTLSNTGVISGTMTDFTARSLVWIASGQPTQLSNSTVPIGVSLFPALTSQILKSYTADLCSTPGVLSSYSITAINRKMNDTYAAWLATNPSSDPFGVDYRCGEYGVGYFENVVEPNAQEIGPNGQRYLEFAMSNDGYQRSSCDLSNITGNEWSVGIDASLGLEFSEEGEGDGTLIGLTAAVEAHLTLGGELEFNAKFTSTDEKKSGMSLHVEVENFPQGVLPNMVVAYTWRMYLLKPDTRWTQEITLLSDYNSRADAVPVNAMSAPWKIMFVVDEASIVTI
jgi:hypothetical protein